MNKRLFLIDGHALIFKMYYAFLRRPMINSKGADMSILFGFTKYVLELIEKEKPTHLAVAFDPPGGTFRHEMYPDYKGTRSESPQLIIDSLEPLTELCQAMKIPVLMIKGFEADDVIGSMAKRAEKEGFEVYMVTPDKDYGQLISPSIFQYKPGKGGSDSELVDTAKICEKYGIDRPEQVIEILTICGDTSDNVPGVKGVGEVGAGKLIAKFGTVEEIYAHIEELTPRQREAFENAKGHIDMSHDLVTIKTDIEIDVRSEDMAIRCCYDPTLADLFEKYEFGSLKKYIGDVKPSEPKEKKTLPINVADVMTVRKEARSRKKCAIITEGNGDNIFSNIRRLIIATSDEKNEVTVAEGSPSELSDILSDAGIMKFGYDLKNQRDLLSTNGFSLEGKLMDIQLMHYLINPEKSHKIEILSRAYLDINIEELAGEKEPAQELSLFDDAEAETGGSDRFPEAAASILLGECIMKEMKELGVDSMYDTMEEPLLKVLSDMEMEGVKVDLAQLRKYAS